MCRGRRPLVLEDMRHPLPHQGHDVRVGHPVVHLAAAPTGFDQSHLPQAAQVMGDCRLTDPHQAGQRAHIAFALYQRRDDLYPAPIAEGAEELGDMGRGMGIQRGGGSFHQFTNI